MIQTQSFIVNQPTQIEFGVGSCANLHETVKKLGGSNVFLVVDPGLMQSGIVKKVTASLDKADIPYTLYDNVQPEPGLQLADAGAELAQKEKADCVVGVGGGSALDIAKAISILLTNSGKAEDYLGLGKIKHPGVPKIMIPTTAAESRPPLRKAPRGTSDIIRRRTASSR